MAWGFGNKKSSTPAGVEALNVVPAALFLTDPSGTVTYRNPAGGAQTKAIVDRYGPGIMEALRDRLAEIVRTSTTFPVSTIAHTMHEGTKVEVSVLVDRAPGGFVGVWEDVTQTQSARRVASEVSGQLTQSSRGLSVLGEELKSDVADVSDLANAVAADAEQLSASIREIATRSANAASSTATVVQAASGASGRLSELDKVAAKIGEVSKLITAIAEQTNLLALNATIEAARAGDAGRGFAVVAGEVKNLAGKTREATDEITAMIDSVQGASGAAVASIQEILGLVSGAREEQDAVSAAVREQSAVAEEMSRSAATVTAAASTSARAVARLRDSADAMAQHSAALTSVVSP